MSRTQLRSRLARLGLPRENVSVAPWPRDQHSADLPRSTVHGLAVRKEKGVDDHAVVSHDDWIEARESLLAKEKEFTRVRNQ